MSAYKLTSLLRQGKLIQWVPSSSGLVQKRRLIIASEVHDWLTLSKGGEFEPLEQRRQQSVAFCDRFVSRSGRLGLSLSPVGFRKTLLAMKIINPGAGVRIFGSLLDGSTFIGTHLYVREEIVHKRRPKSEDQKEWRPLVKQSRDALDALFPSMKVLTLDEAVRIEDGEV